MECIFDEVLSGEEGKTGFEVSKKALDDLRDEGRKGQKLIILRAICTANSPYNDNWGVIKLQVKSKEFTSDEWFDLGSSCFGDKVKADRVSLLIDMSHWAALRILNEGGVSCRVQMVGEKKKLAIIRQAIVDAWEIFTGYNYAIRN